MTFTSGINMDRPPVPGGAVVAAIAGSFSFFARALALELGPTRVNVVSPGWVDTPMWDVLHKYGHDYKLVFVGDASMSPYEITHPGGSVEHFNDESGAVWMHRLTTTYPAAVWLNPVPEQQWGYSQSAKIIRELMTDRMYPLTLAGLDDAMRELTRKR